MAKTVRKKRNGSPRQLGYDNAQDSNRRRAHRSTLLHEDDALNKSQRKRLVGGTRDAVRNVVLLGWAVRKHLDFVCRHEIDFNTGDEAFDRELEAWVTDRSQPDLFDIRGAHDRQRWVRMAEARRILDGDIGALKLASRHIQAIESDRIRDPDPRQLGSNQQSEWRHGVRCNRAGRIVEFAVHGRNGTGQFQLERVVQAQRMIWHAWHDSHFRLDACRGVSPFASSLGDFLDIGEIKEYGKARVKLSQMVGLVFKTAMGEGVGVHTLTESVDTDGDGVGDQEKYEVDIGRAPWKLELEPGDEAEFLDTKTDAAELTQFLDWCVFVAIKALDLPINMFDESRTNFFGSKAGITVYLLSANQKRKDVQALLSEWLNWQIDLAVSPAIREIQPPRGMDVQQIKRSYEWIPTGLPWFDRSREVLPTLQAIAGGIDSYSRVIRDLYGIPFDRFLDQIARDQAQIQSKGIRLGDFSKILYPGGSTIIEDEDENTD